MKRALLIAGGTVGGLGAVLSITPPHLGVSATNVSALASGVTTDVPQTDTSSAAPVSSPTTSTPSAVASSATTAATTAATSKTTASATATKPAAKSTTTKKASSAPAATKAVTQATTKTAASTPATQAPATQAPATQTPTPTPTKATPTPTPTPVASGVSGSFTGATYDAAENNRLWGRVTVTVTLKNGEISNISAVQSPSSRGNNAFSYLTPAVLTQKLTVKAVMAISPTSLVSQIRGYTGASYSSFAYWQSLQSALSKAGL